MVTTNSILVSVDKALNDEIITNGGIKFYIDPTYNPEWNVSVTGKVSALPKHPKGANADKIKELKIGDEVAFSYSVISEMRFSENPELFVETTEGSDYFKKFENSKGKQITVVAYDGAISKRWACVLFDKEAGVLDGRDNISEAEKDRWLAQFSFGSTQDYRFRNLIEIDNGDGGSNDYWNVDMTNILAVKRGDDVVSVSDFVITKPIVQDATSAYNLINGVNLPPMMVAFELTDRAEVVDEYKEIGLSKGDIVSTEDCYICRYDLWGQKYFLINKKRVLGKWQR